VVGKEFLCLPVFFRKVAEEIGISQAQVSRLEKSAIERIKKI
jgi:DNA-directed RNA polymerase specialized sigma subunit